ncbi:MAG: NAD(P)/FAD-dependent oxidoreductase [Actinomycetota bacterium]|nr:NAD(P)/FAD-dependent oxidoreductase [Actinomycetota bacterium]
MTTRPRPRVVIVGAGFGGINAAKALAGASVDVTLIDRDNYHGFWPLLYQVATAGLGPDDIAHPVRGMFNRAGNVHVRLGTVSGVDFEHRVVLVEAEENLPYDYLILAAGSSTSDFGIPGVEEHAFPLKTLPDAVRLRNHILLAFERADACPELVDRGILTIVLAGGGSTGVEMAGSLSELISRNLAGDFPRLDVTRSRVVLVEMADHLIGGFSAASQSNARETLVRMGVEVRLSTAIARVEARSVELKDGTSIDCGTVVWTAGIRANPLADRLGLEQGKGGAIQVLDDLSIKGHPDVFAIGDLALATDRRGKPYPQLAQVAIQGGRHSARCVRRRMAGKPTKPFQYHNHGIMATIGRRAAVAELPGGIKLRGTAGWVSWLAVHLVFLVGFHNRMIVLAKWGWNYLTWDRASRVILDEGFETPTGQARA